MANPVVACGFLVGQFMDDPALSQKVDNGGL